MRRTALYPVHKALGARLVEFAGWEMPVQYEGIREEHMAVRTSAGVFDVSHMGEIFIKGRDAGSFCQWLTTNDVRSVGDFQAQYTLFCNTRGGVVDDVILYKLSDDGFMFCTNASNTAKVFEWITGARGGYDVEITDRSPEFSQLALQGPGSSDILAGVLGDGVGGLKRFRFRHYSWEGAGLLAARTGYTGEDGYEIFLPRDKGPAFWDALMDAGRDSGIKPCGLGARDTLRIEMGYSLYGHEIDEDVTPLEAGLGRYVKMEGDDFLGRDALRKAAGEGFKRRLIGFEMIDRGIPRQGYGIYSNGDLRGEVTSGTLSPSLDKSIGLGYLKSDAGDCGNIQIGIRSTAREARIVDIPFYKKADN